ncbi:Casparian strip membrane protein 3 [Hibiscus syriacus]|uniref:CASP-like protein n=1 Tax=Hibiscus syriacus TaxID=106335 RepID=A0A6A3BMM2_HIBSY|nr:casparian strip membrane protein 3-like [Hibiscus syriacus]KAE8716099.1 Casparian strip membrane protein 3 [Hibiscus syriacus]
MKTLSVESGETSHETNPENSMINGVAVLEFVLRFLAAGGTLASAMAMGTAEETVPLVSQSILLNPKFSDLPMFTFFVIANSVACAYLVLSLPLSFYHIIKRATNNSRLVFVMFDTAMLALVTAGASAAASIVYLAHEGNAQANWSAVCQQLDSFCERTSGSLIASFVSVLVLMLVIVSSAIAISHR